MAAIHEVIERAEAIGWDVKNHGTHRFTTVSQRDSRTTLHDWAVVEITPSVSQRHALATLGHQSYSKTGVPFTVLFEASGAFAKAFRTSFTGSPERAAASVEQTIEKHYSNNENYSDRYRDQIRQERLPKALYGVISATRNPYSKADVLEALTKDDPIRVLALRQERQAADQAKEIERLQGVRDKNRQFVEERSDQAAEALEDLRASVVSAYPKLAEHRGVLDAILLAVVGTDNDEALPVQRFLSARAGISQAIAEAHKAEELLATYSTQVSA